MIYRDSGCASEREDRLFEQFPAVLTPLEVMDILGVGKNTVYRLLNSGELQGFRVGRSWKVTSDSLEHFMLSAENSPSFQRRPRFLYR